MKKIILITLSSFLIIVGCEKNQNSKNDNKKLKVLEKENKCNLDAGDSVHKIDPSLDNKVEKSEGKNLDHQQKILKAFDFKNFTQVKCYFISEYTKEIFEDENLVIINGFPYRAFKIPQEDIEDWQATFDDILAYSEHFYSEIKYPKKNFDLDFWTTSYQETLIKGIIISIEDRNIIHVRSSDEEVDIYFTNDMIFYYHDKSYLDNYLNTDSNLSKDPYAYENARAIFLQIHHTVIKEDKLKELRNLKNRVQIIILKAHHWNLFGNSFRNYEKYEQAEKAYLQAVELDPKNEEPYGNLLSLYILTENYENYENIYQKGMENAEPEDFIVYQDGRYQYKTGDFDMAYSAALSVLTAKKMQDEGAWVLGVNGLLGMSEDDTDDEKRVEYYEEAKEMLSKGMFIFPNSQSLKDLSEMFKK